MLKDNFVSIRDVRTTTISEQESETLMRELFPEPRTAVPAG
jgi:hypothetical protein